jgi:hypothetical protein
MGMSTDTLRRMWIVRTSVNGYNNRDFVELCVDEQPAQVVTWMNNRWLMPRSIEEYHWQEDEWHEASLITYPPGFTAKVRNGGIGVA